MERRGAASGSAVNRPLVIYQDLVLLQLAALVFLVDQATKALVQKSLYLGESIPSEGFLRISHTHNTGSAFGLFQGQNTALIVVAFIGIAILVLIYQSQRRPSNLLRLSIGLQLGGAFGNLADRLFLGHVIDFLDVGPWPVFNVADSSIVVGLVLLAWIFLAPHQASHRGTAARTPARDGKARDSVSWCPVCDGDMVSIRQGWRCSTCGVKELGEDQSVTGGHLGSINPSEDPERAVGESQE